MDQPLRAGGGDPLNALYLAFLNSWRGLRHGARTERAVRQELVLLVLGIPLALAIGAPCGSVSH